MGTDGTRWAEGSGPDGSARVLAGRYRLEGRLGRGGMGVVWRATDQLLGRQVAVKELAPDEDGAVPPDEAWQRRSRTLREARALAQLGHPHIIGVHDVIEVDGRPYIVMELVDGLSLAERIARTGPVGAPEAARIGLALLGALRRAHASGVLHRDLKPANVLLEADTGRVVLTDFGIAQVTGATTLTESGSFLGSPEYTAPERMAGARTGPESDLWSLGVLLCAALSGTSPFHRDSLGGVLLAVVSDEVRVPVQARPLLPVIRGLLERDPDRRLDAAAAERMLRSYADTGRVPPLPPGAGPPPEARGAARVRRAPLSGRLSQLPLPQRLRGLGGSAGAPAPGPHAPRRPRLPHRRAASRPAAPDDHTFAPQEHSTAPSDHTAPPPQSDHPVPPPQAEPWPATPDHHPPSATTPAPPHLTPGTGTPGGAGPGPGSGSGTGTGGGTGTPGGTTTGPGTSPTPASAPGPGAAWSTAPGTGAGPQPAPAPPYDPVPGPAHRHGTRTDWPPPGPQRTVRTTLITAALVAAVAATGVSAIALLVNGNGLGRRVPTTSASATPVTPTTSMSRLPAPSAPVTQHGPNPPSTSPPVTSPSSRTTTSSRSLPTDTRPSPSLPTDTRPSSSHPTGAPPSRSLTAPAWPS